jgi:CRISPR-associated protein Cas4
MNVLALLLAAGVVAYVVLGWLQASRRAKLGLTNASVVAADDSEIGSPTLRSDRLGLVGRPNHLVRIDRKIIPVQQKPRARRVHDSHVMQLAAQCMLVTDVYGVRPPYGLLVLANGVQQQVPFTRDLEKRVLETMARMHVVLKAGTQPGRRWMGSRCRACGFSRPAGNNQRARAF